MYQSYMLGFVMVAMLVFAAQGYARPGEWVIREGKLYVDGQAMFLKIGKPLRNFADAADCEQLIRDLQIIRKKNYNCLELNCYWHHFDRDGDGTIDVSLEPLSKLIREIRKRGMFPCLSVETYGVGGGQIPGGFWKEHPDAVAIDHLGRKVSDDEYGFGSVVPSFFSPDYLRASRQFIRELVRGVPYEDILYFETTVEPQYMGNHALEYGPDARAAYEAWLKHNGIAGPEWPDKLPASDGFVNDPIWNQFRAQSLAQWVNGDAAAMREVAGEDAYVAVDYLETAGGDMRNRNGDSMTFLTHLTCATIIQVNWHWSIVTHKPNDLPYRNVREVMARTKRDWAISEHMTINGSDYRVEEMPELLRNTLRQGTRFGWEFVDLGASSHEFALYNPDWSPKTADQSRG